MSPLHKGIHYFKGTRRTPPQLTCRDFMIAIHQICLSLWSGDFKRVQLTAVTSERKERAKAKKRGWRQRKDLRIRRKAERSPRREASSATGTSGKARAEGWAPPMLACCPYRRVSSNAAEQEGALASAYTG